MKPIEKQSAAERKQTLEELLTKVVFPQRLRLLRARDHTWQSAYVDDGYLAELIAAIVVGVPGTRRRGVTRSFGDLADGTEVKKGYRADPNIDFLISAEKFGNELLIADVPPELLLAAIQGQLNANSCSVQLVESSTNQIFGSTLCKTVGKNAFIFDRAADEGRLRLARNSAIPDGSNLFCVRQERGHINFGNKTRSQVDQILASRPVLVFYQHDLVGSFSIAVVQIEMTPGQRNEYLNNIFQNSNQKKQLQPYLFADNNRTALYSDGPYSVAGSLNGTLLAYAVESRGGVNISHWFPHNAPLVRDCAGLLTEKVPRDNRPNFRHDRLELDWTDVHQRRRFAHDFFTDAIAGYSRTLQPFCEACSVTRNIGLGNVSQHLASAVTGLRGTRSGARGGDLVEIDGTTYSDVKLATGQRGDTMGTEDMPRLTLGWDHQKMIAWKRMIPVRAVELPTPNGPRWQVLVHAPTESCMSDFGRQVKEYFAGRVNNGSGGLQYHTSVFPHHSYGTADRTLCFECIGHFTEGAESLFPTAMPEW